MFDPKFKQKQKAKLSIEIDSKIAQKRQNFATMFSYLNGLHHKWLLWNLEISFEKPISKRELKSVGLKSQNQTKWTCFKISRFDNRSRI